MTRVSSFGQSQSMINNLLNNQKRVFESQEQLNSGKKSQDFAGMAGDTISLMNSRAFRERVNTFENMIQNVQGKVDANDVQLEGILDMARNFRQSIMEVLAQNQAVSFEEILGEAVNFISDSLNAQVGGQFIFSGSKTDVKPYTGNSLTDLKNAASAASLFVDDSKILKARVSDNVEVEFGLNAQDIALDMFKSLKSITDYHFGGSGPLNGTLTDAQRTFLTNELQTFDTAIDKTQSVQTKNGLRAKRLQTISDQHKDTKVFLDTYISDLEDTNMAEAITKLNIDKTALESSLQTMAMLSGLSLLDFI